MAGRVRRGRYSLAELLTCAFMAGAGHSGPEIAESLSRDTVAIYSLLRRFGLRLVPKNGDQIVVHAIISRDTMEVVNGIARRRRLEPIVILSAIIENALQGGENE